MTLFFRSLGLCFFVLLSVYLSLCAPACGATAKKPHQILMDLKHEMILLGERRASPDTFTEAAQEAANHLATSAHDPAYAAFLVERDMQGMTPLIAASFEGYAELVEELLKHPIVVAHINDTDAKGASAATYAAFAFKQSLWVCNPTIVQNNYMFTPLRVVQPYYTGHAQSPYEKIQALLIFNGVKFDPETDKTTWSTFCRMATNDTVEKVQASRNLQKTLIIEGKKALNALGSQK